MISSGSCFPNCQIFFHGQPFKTHPSFSPSSLSNSTPPYIHPSFLGFRFLLCLTNMGMATQTQTQTQTQFHVLAVDDSLVDRKLIERLLKTSSYQVTSVDSGSKALEFLGLNNDNEDEERNSVCSDDEQVGVNLIITDYCMPGMTGYDLLRKIKQSSSVKHIPVVIMSSENIPSRINRCLEDGAQEFFLKPVQLSDVNKLRPHLIKGINKRKGMEDIHSPHRTRPRYNV